MNSELVKERILRNKQIRSEWNRYDLAFEISQLLAELRLARGLTQEKLAKLVGTKQASIARAESGRRLPSLSFLNKIAVTLKTKILVKFELLEDIQPGFRSDALFKSECLIKHFTGVAEPGLSTSGEFSGGSLIETVYG
jgi:transcriptional regulator with XRE-family HTH domain